MGSFPLKTGISYFGNRFLRHFQKDLREIRRAHCNFIVLTFSETDLQYYEGTMRDFVKASHDKGLEVYLDPWGVGRAFGGESYSEFLLHHPEARQVSSVGGSLPIACLNHPLFHQFMRRWCEAAFRMKIDTFFWDEPHFHLFRNPSRSRQWSCRCTVCQALFRKWEGHRMPESYTSQVEAFREWTLFRFLKRFCDFTKREGFRNAVCFLPRSKVFDRDSLKDWSRVARLPSVDILGTDPYWHPRQDLRGYVGAHAEELVTLTRLYHKEPQLWILNYRIPRGDEKKISLAIQTAYEAGVRNFAAWSYWGTGQMSFLASQDPDRVWGTLAKAYKKLHETKLTL